MANAENNTPECPTCGRDDFNGEQWMKSHHKQAHGESIAGRPVDCSYCGDQIRAKPYEIQNQEYFFCDRDCKGQYWSEHFSGDGHVQWKGRVKLACEICGNDYEVVPSRKDTSRTCSRGCLDQLRSKEHSGRNHYNWRGGQFPYGEGWNEAKREAVRERDGRECQHCGRSEKKHIKKFGRKHNVHHIEKARSFDDPKNRNAMDNLITLCQGDCHETWEAIAPLRPDTA